MLIKSKTFSKIVFLALTVFFSINAFAQGTTGTIEGTVFDPGGAPVPGASVSIVNENNTSGFKKNATTDEKGYFIFAEVPPGKYQIIVTRENFRSLSQNVEVSADKRTSIKFELSVNSADDGNTQVSAQTSASVVTEIIRAELPSRPTFSSLLKISPYVRPELLAAGFQINGASGSENTFFIDGQEVTNFRTGLLNSNYDLPLELLEEVQVKANGLEAQYGGALGGVVNVLTKGGNDEWRGSFGLSFAFAKLQGNPNPVLNRFGSAAGQIEYFQPSRDGGTDFFPTASVSGPIIKEKLWFFSSYSPQIYRTTRTIDYFSTGANPSGRTISETIKYKTNVRTEAAFLRLDAQPTEKIRMFGTFLYNPIVQDGALPANSEGLTGFPQSAGGLRGAEFLATRGGRQNSNIAGGQIKWDLSKNFILNFRAGRSFLNEKLDSYGIPRITRFVCAGNPASVPGSNCSAGFQNISNNSVRDYDASTRTTFDAEGSVVGIDGFGRHNFKFGYQYNHLFNKIREGYADTGIVQLFYGVPISNIGAPITPTPGNLGSGFLQRFGTVGEASNTNQAFYGQDGWNIKNRLHFNIGIRFENEDFPAYGEDVNIKFGWADKIAPRLGTAFDVFGDGKTKIYASYSWYYDRLKYELSRSSPFAGAQIFYRDFFEILPSRGASYTNYTYQNILGNNVDSPGGRCPIVGGSGWSVCQFSFVIPSQFEPPLFPTPPIDPDIKPARSSEYVIGVERELGAGFLLSGAFIHKQIDRAIEDAGVFNSQGSETYIIGNPGFGLICEVAEDGGFPCPKAERKYDAFEIILNKRASGRYFLNFSYTFSRLYGNYSGLASSDEFGRAVPNVTRYFDLSPYGFDADGNPDNGRLATDRPHVFKAFGGYTFDWKRDNVNRTFVSAFTTIQSGTPLTTIYNLYSLSTSILFERGDLGRTEIFSETDLRVSHQYSFGRDNRFSIEPYVVFLNLFDERNELSRQTLISTTNFSSTQLTQGGCTTCQTEIDVFNTILNGGGISQFVQNYLNARGVSATGFRNDYNQPNVFQSPRDIRLGVRFSF